MLIDISHCCAEHANEAIESLFAKAAGDPPGDGIWLPHESVFIQRLVELFTDRGLARISGIQAELSKWLEHTTHNPGPPQPKPAGGVRRWTKGEVALTKLYLETLPPDQFTLDDWTMVVDYLVQRYMPAEDLIEEAKWLAYRSSMMGRVQSRLDELSAAGADALLAAMPASVAAAQAKVGLSPAQAKMIEYGSLRCAENVVALADEARHALRRMVVDYQQALAMNDPTLRESLWSRMFDRFGEMNRDWRRIAITEAGENANQGLIASLPEGARVKRVEQYANACPFCRKIDGRVMTVVPDSSPEKDGDTMVWPGKTNIGRSAAPRKKTPEGLVDRLPSEMWWIAAGTQHPHCRGRWVVVQQDPVGDDPFDQWMAEALSKV